MSEVALREQRDAVRAHAAAVRHSLPATPTEAWGRFEGCDSAFNDVYATFRYLARLRYAEAPAPLVVGEAPGLTTETWAPPAGGLLVTVHGPCVELPSAVRAEWTQRGSAEPLD
jgi:hypothetical protein